ncbi:DUF3089 domain-containing protein [Altererythrobacter sp. GH1-8]|uniref:DUF3089 domain-containing protein n=1 Tax=Altererythrobacter sp. GH1-8 TaxID=3349333 RepID=UPI00374D8366
MAKKFLGIVAIVIVLFIAGAILLAAFPRQISEIVFVPSVAFEEPVAQRPDLYAEPGMWYSHPDLSGEDPARWQPAYSDEGRTLPTPADPAPGNFALFFIHPTSYVERDSWNARFSDAQAEHTARTYIRGMATPFGKASEIWIPRYRQAAIGAFLTDKPEGQMAIDAAYQDVAQAYAEFRKNIDPEIPIVLVGHSQGSLHLMRLLKEEIAATPEADRLVAAYAIGWPISVEHDLPAMGFSACSEPTSTGCVISWSSFAEPADPSDLLESYSSSTGLDGKPRGDSAILCSNPLTGGLGGAAEAARNLGTLVPDNSLSDGALVRSSVPARCDDRGLLLIGDPPQMGNYVLPGNNYHVYDIPLFWANTQADVEMRVDAWLQSR